MRIAVVVKSLTFGGMERAALTLAEAFQKEGHESHLIYLNETSNKLPAADSMYLHSFELKKTMRKSLVGFLWHLISKILNIIIRKSYFVWSAFYQAPIFKRKMGKLERRHGAFDIIIFRGRGTFEMIWPLHDKRHVFVNEGIVYYGKNGYLDRLYARLLFRNRNISSVSRGVASSFRELQERAHFDVRKHAIITNPIDVGRVVSLAKEKVNEIAKPYIVSVGRFHPVKNYPLLVEAYAYARGRLGLAADLVLVGDGKEKEKINKEIERLSLERHVHMLGFAPNPYPWIRNAELLVVTSRHEGLGMVLLEAMACGTDVIATDSPGGVRDVLHGELKSRIASPDKVSLARKMMEALQNPITNFDEYLKYYAPEEISVQFIENFAG